MTRHPHRLIAKIAATLALALAAAPVASATTDIAPSASGPTPSVANSQPVVHPTGRGLRGMPGRALHAARTTTGHTSFHWGDAAIGAAGALGVALLAAGGIAATADRRRLTRSAAQPTG